MRAGGGGQLGALVVREQQRDVLADPRRGDHVLPERRSRPLGSGSVSVGVGVNQGSRALRSAGQTESMSPTVTLGEPRLQERVGAPVDGDEDGLEVAHVRPDDPEVALVPRTARDDERVAVTEAGLERREADALREQPSFPPRAGGEACCRRTPPVPR